MELDVIEWSVLTYVVGTEIAVIVVSAVSGTSTSYALKNLSVNEWEDLS
ncbi:hypothetical protein MNQ98_15100 [Paenibacillus sp. N3/727]|nr:hypothetical protein [Paenibacillus sp. N3/727]UNK15885.1 hypothetical protein MNQ98_15100 [Paenibacillus sp. N3/727]